MADFCTLVGNVRNLNRSATWGTVKITSTDSAKAEGQNIVITGTAVVQLDASGSFAIPLGAGSYKMTLNDVDEVSFTLTGPFATNQTVSLTSLTLT
jgi:hypothetical protein